MCGRKLVIVRQLFAMGKTKMGLCWFPASEGNRVAQLLLSALIDLAWRAMLYCLPQFSLENVDGDRLAGSLMCRE